MPGPFHPLIEQWKTIAGPVQWSSPSDPDDGHIGFLVPLEIEGVVIADFALRGGAYEPLQDQALMLQLEIGTPGIRSRTPLVRLDWRPRSPLHKNPDKTMLGGTHIHPFDFNWLEKEQRMRAGNLPFAEKIPEIHTFSAVLDYAKNLFRINNIDDIPVPEWSPKLL